MKKSYKYFALIVLLSLLVSLVPFSMMHAQEGTAYIIVHALNPEDVEIASIQGMDPNCVQIYDGDTLIGYGAHDAETHNKPLVIAPGAHTIKAKFNGITLEQNANLQPDQTQVLTFTFGRVEISNTELFTVQRTSCSSTVYEICGYIGDWWWWSAVQDPHGFISSLISVSLADCPAYLTFDIQVSHSISVVSYDIQMEASSSLLTGGNLSVMEVMGFSANCGLDKRMPIPARNDFNHWYIQSNSNQTPEVGSFLFQDPSGARLDLINKGETGYVLRTGSATISYAGVRHVCDGGLGGQIEIDQPAPVSRSTSASISFPMTAENLRFSSIPYDLLGTGVKDEQNQPPVASFKSWNIQDIGTGEPALIEGHHMVGGQIEFDASESFPDGGNLTYYWDFGDRTGNVTCNPTIMHVFKTPEKFTVTLSVKNDKGISSTNPATEDFDLSLKPGDLLVIRSGWPYANIFDFFGLRYTHVGMYVGMIDGEYRVVESTISSPPLSNKIGVQETTIERWGYPYEKYVDAVRVTDNPEIATRAVAFARGLALDPHPHFYDTDVWEKQIDCSHTGGPCPYCLCDKYYCSELVWAAYYTASNRTIDLSPRTDTPRLVAVSPDDIINYPLSTNVGWHHEEYPNKKAGMLSISALCPVDISVTDPSGLVITKDSSQIPDAAYVETDLNDDSDIDNLVIIPEPKLGYYSIQVIPEPGALPEDTYSLEVTVGEQHIVLANDIPISEIPSGGYTIHSTETGIMAAPVADAGPDQTVEATSAAGAQVALNGSGSYDPDNGPQPLSYSWIWAGGSASGVNPTVVIPMGITLVTLAVSDGELTSTDTVMIAVQDTTPPSVNITSPAQGQTYLNTQGTIPVQYIVTDACDKAPNIAVTLDGNVFTGDKVNLCGMASGQHTLTVSATDHSGNTGTASSTFTVVPKAMKSFTIKNLLVQWAPHIPGWRGSDQFSAAGRLQLPQGYTWASLQNQATVCITIGSKSGNDTVIFKGKLYGKPSSMLWSYMGTEQPPGYGMNINNMVIWWSPQGTNWNGWAGFYIGGILQLPASIGVSTTPPDVTITIEIPVTTAAGCGSLLGTQTVKCSVSKPFNLWFYNAWPNPPAFPCEPTGKE